MKRITALVALTLYILTTSASGAAAEHGLPEESDADDASEYHATFRLPVPSPTGRGGGFGEARLMSRSGSRTPGGRHTPGGTLRKSPSMFVLPGTNASPTAPRTARPASAIPPKDAKGDSAARLSVDTFTTETDAADPARKCAKICTYTINLINDFLAKVTLNLEVVNTFLDTNRSSTDLCPELSLIRLGLDDDSTTADIMLWPRGELRATCPRLINDLNDILLDLSDLKERLATCFTTASFQAAVQTATEKFITARILARDICLAFKTASRDARATSNADLEKLLFDAGHDLETTELADDATFAIGRFEVVQAQKK